MKWIRINDGTLVNLDKVQVILATPSEEGVEFVFDATADFTNNVEEEFSSVEEAKEALKKYVAMVTTV